MKDAAHELAATSARVSSPSIEEAYVLPQFGDWPFAFTRIDAIYVWTQGGNQVGRKPDDYLLFLAVHEQDVDAWEAFFELFDSPPQSSDSPVTSGTDHYRPSSIHNRHLKRLSPRDGTNTRFRNFPNKPQQFGSTFGRP